ncbi:hypothetical protein [Allofrancisella frigidaquae]|uniref:N-formylglutamate amidohydrolase n=1 Tax=Allofrancisella frigidaquae TaxID=1085644 RepID=A0A6M3HSA9_9GAMM|nr:hypothetical protein [Allofrancisella frigidaquae]QIV94025.1 hypothetical protein E3E15_01080 [Allofrancisella frigidaquae]
MSQINKLTKEPFCIKYYDCATLYFYTQENLKFDLLITCPHAEIGMDFINYDYPVIAELVKLNIRDLADFLSIEYDFGAQQLSHAIAEKLYTTYGLNTLVLEPSFPRSVLDANRLYPNCLRNIIDYSKHLELKNSLVKLYNDYMAKLCHVVALAKSYNALSIELHTMSSYSPNLKQEYYSEAVKENPDNLLEYINLYKNSHKEGVKRVTELFTGDHANGIFASKELLNTLTVELQSKGIVVEYDRPYILAEHLVAHYLVSELNTVCVDIPKDLLSVTTTDNDNYNIAELTVDNSKLKLIVEAFAKALVDAYDLLQPKKGFHV